MYLVDITRETIGRLRAMPLPSILSSKRAQQVSVLYSSMLLLLPIGLLIGAIKARGLGPQDYGILAFYTTVFSVLILIFRFGIFYSASLLLAENDDPKTEQELVGSLLVRATQPSPTQPASWSFLT